MITQEREIIEVHSNDETKNRLHFGLSDFETSC